ncbi:MAG: hypothetical protein R3253_11800 [Longimicrobiales bacterium]|nr:hypothetical protein [Longimicrobiales bacterium]
MRRPPIVVLLICLFTVAVAASPSALHGQMAPGARSVGMGGGGMVFATGVDAIEWNPANLDWARGWNVSVFELGMATMSSGATFGEILTIMGGEGFPLFSTDLSVAQIVNQIPDDGLQLFTVTEGFATAYAAEQGDVPQPGSPMPSIGIAIGNIGVRVRSQVLGEATVSRELADLIGNGFALEDIQNYAVGNTGFSTTSFSEITVSYGTKLGGLLSVGAGGRYVIGHGMTRGRFFEPQTDLSPAPGEPFLTIESVAVEATGGSGFGLDVGLSLDLPMGFRAAASGTNVVQRMTWDDGLIAHTATWTDADFDENVDFLDVLDRYDAQPVDPNAVPLPVYQVSQGLFRESYFPQVFRGGVGWRSGGTTVEAVGIKVSPRGRFTPVWGERISLGVEQNLPVLTLRAGYAVGSDDLTALTGGVGLGLGPVQLEASAGKFSADGAVVSKEGYYGTFALQLKGGGL